MIGKNFSRTGKRIFQFSCYFMPVLVCLAFLGACTSGPATPDVSLEPVSLQLQWMTQAQFAGYYVALDKGWYREEGIDLTINPGGPEISATDQVAKGTSQFGTSFLTDLSVAIQQGKPLISIAQVQQMNGLLLISKKSSDIKRPRDIIGKRVGVWLGSWESQFNALLAKEGIARNQVNVVAQGWDMAPFLKDELDVASAMVYNEYHTVLENGVKLQDLNIIDYILYGLGFAGDTLFSSLRIAREKPDLGVRMVRTSLRGWQYAIDNPKEAVDIVLKYANPDARNRNHQLSMMREISKLVEVPWRELGYTDPTTVQRMINTLQRYKVLEGTVPAEKVFTNDFWEKARLR